MTCELCPRRCRVDRTQTFGFCKMPWTPTAALAGPHFGEEPCIAGYGGAGTVFFSGCSLGCVYCQNRAISRDGAGKAITVERLAEIFRELEENGADCIDLVTPTHFADAVANALTLAKPTVPVVYNCGGYERVETLRRLEGLVDVYLPDYKYADASLARRLSNAPDYPTVALHAIREMVRQTGKPVFDEDGLLQKGTLIRHLVLPGYVDNTLDCLDTLTAAFGEDEVLLSVMSQYTPPAEPLPDPNLNRRLTEAEYDRVLDYLYLLGNENVFVQELSAASEFYVPDFDGTGV